MYCDIDKCVEVGMFDSEFDQFPLRRAQVRVQWVGCQDWFVS